MLGFKKINYLSWSLYYLCDWCISISFRNKENFISNHDIVFVEHKTKL